MVPFVETCPSFSVLEVFELEAAGRPVWGDEEEEDLLCEKTVHPFECMVIDSIYRGCHFASVTKLWEVVVASEPQHASLFGVTCELNDVMVIYIFCFCFCFVKFRVDEKIHWLGVFLWVVLNLDGVGVDCQIPVRLFFKRKVIQKIVMLSFILECGSTEFVAVHDEKANHSVV